MCSLILICTVGKDYLTWLRHYQSLTLSQTANFRLFRTKRFCRRQFQIWWKWQRLIQMGRKHWGKRRNCSSRAISPFHTVFSKDLYHRHVKTMAYLRKGKKISFLLVYYHLAQIADVCPYRIRLSVLAQCRSGYTAVSFLFVGPHIWLCLNLLRTSSLQLSWLTCPCNRI